MSRARAILAGLALASCGGESPGVARLDAILTGGVDWSRADAHLSPAELGQRFALGDQVCTSPDGGARIALAAGGGLLLGPATTIRFGEDRRVAVDGEIAADGAGAVLELDIGSAEIESGARVRVPDGRAGGFEVLVGRAIVHAGSAAPIELAPGDRLEVEVGRATVRRIAPAPPAPPPATSTPLSAVVRGQVRARARDAVQAKALPAGRREIAPGTALELLRGARVELARGEERATIEGPAALIAGPADGGLFAASAGQAKVSATATDVVVTLPGGRLVVRRGAGDGSRAALSVDREQSRVVAELGAVEVQAGDRREELAIGEAAELGRTGELAVNGRPPSSAVIAIDAGLSATIHDPAPPTDVRIRFAGACPDGGVLELGGAPARRTRGADSAIVRLERGEARYRLRCLEDDRLAARPAASGRLIVVRDAGTRPLPATSPTNTVDADGRKYTVLYQSRLPALRFRWPGAPGAPRYDLEVTPARGRPITASAATPTVSLAAGRLREGTYRYRLRAGARTSLMSTLTIDFDNAAASAYLSAPAVDAPWRPRVMVAGATTEGWRVSAGGAALPLDAKLRFAGEVPAPGDETGLAIELRHPERGVHLYVRRLTR